MYVVYTFVLDASGTEAETYVTESRGRVTFGTKEVTNLFVTRPLLGATTLIIFGCTNTSNVTAGGSVVWVGTTPTVQVVS